MHYIYIYTNILKQWIEIFHWFIEDDHGLRHPFYIKHMKLNL